MCSSLLADDNLRPFVGNARVVTGVEFHENPSNRSRDSAVNILCSTNKVPVNTDWSQKNVTACEHCAYSARCGLSRKFLE